MALVILQSILPSELVREICSYDSTYHGYVKTNMSKVCLMKYVYNLSYKQMEWKNRIIETILYYTYHDEWDWYNEWGGVFENTGGYTDHYWQFYHYNRFRIVYSVGNTFMKFKIVPNILTISDEDYLANSIRFDGIICDFQLHTRLLDMKTEQQRNHYLSMCSEWEDGSKLHVKDIQYLPIYNDETDSHYIWVTV